MGVVRTTENWRARGEAEVEAATVGSDGYGRTSRRLQGCLLLQGFKEKLHVQICVGNIST